MALRLHTHTPVVRRLVALRQGLSSHSKALTQHNLHLHLLCVALQRQPLRNSIALEPFIACLTAQSHHTASTNTLCCYVDHCYDWMNVGHALMDSSSSPCLRVMDWTIQVLQWHPVYRKHLALLLISPVVSSDIGLTLPLIIIRSKTKRSGSESHTVIILPYNTRL